MPDGSVAWYQSYIEHYSLHTWMKFRQRKKERYFSLDDVKRKLRDIDELRNATVWTDRANAVYLDNFFVDVRSHVPHFHFKPAHRLRDFYWDVACVYDIKNDTLDGRRREL
mmetsp:Transcript_5029/g.16467  ORF Transcript_5029/g.16467 Transcript_5029/m.16467 type:complete len:111 (-) Transcript_5029:339-671(-)